MAIACAIFVVAETVWLAFVGAGLFGVAVAGILVVPPVAYANFFGRESLGTIRGVTEPFTSLGQAIGAVASGLVFTSPTVLTSSRSSYTRRWAR